MLSFHSGHFLTQFHATSVHFSNYFLVECKTLSEILQTFANSIFLSVQFYLLHRVTAEYRRCFGTSPKESGSSARCSEKKSMPGCMDEGPARLQKPSGPARVHSAGDPRHGRPLPGTPRRLLGCSEPPCTVSAALKSFLRASAVVFFLSRTPHIATHASRTVGISPLTPALPQTP